MKHNLGNSVLSFIKDASSMVNERINKLELADFNFDGITRSLEEARATLSEKLSDLKKNVKSSDKEYVINVPYDREISTITSSTENNIFTSVVVTENENTNGKTERFSTYIPKEYDVDNCITKYDGTQKVMVFRFPKK